MKEPVIIHSPLELLREEIQSSFGDMWEHNDQAHRMKHFEEVYQCGIHINAELNLGVDEKLIMFAAYFHDLFAWSRANHHVLSYNFIKTTDHPLIEKHLNEDERELVALGCLHHRASNDKPFQCEFDQLINAADRGFPGDVRGMLNRAVQYHQTKNPDLPIAQRHDTAVQHLKDKYGPDGYARYPKMYTDVFGEALYQQQRDIHFL